MILNVDSQKYGYVIPAGVVIDELTPGWTDGKLMLLCDGPCQIQDANNIKLSGRVDMDGTKGDILCLGWLRGNWHEISRVIK